MAPVRHVIVQPASLSLSLHRVPVRCGSVDDGGSVNKHDDKYNCSDEDYIRYIHTDNLSQGMKNVYKV